MQNHAPTIDVYPNLDARLKVKTQEAPKRLARSLWQACHGAAGLMDQEIALRGRCL